MSGVRVPCVDLQLWGERGSKLKGKLEFWPWQSPLITPQTGHSCSPVLLKFYTPNLKGATLIFFPSCLSQCKLGVCLIIFTHLYV